MTAERSRKLEPGAVVATLCALWLLSRHGKEPGEYLSRRLSGGWGEPKTFDRRQNGRAHEAGARLFGAYAVSQSNSVWTITEADGPGTRILLPEEY